MCLDSSVFATGLFSAVRRFVASQSYQIVHTGSVKLGQLYSQIQRQGTFSSFIFGVEGLVAQKMVRNLLLR